MNDDARFAELQDAVAGTWSLERELGRGGMGVVYLARDVALDRPVAIKLLHAALASEAEQRERFLREARTGARLSHPHIVPIYDVAEQGALVFFVMGLVDGESLGSRIRREGPLPPTEAERILREVGWALAAAHAAGVLHRDVTAENVLLEKRTGRAMLADFGIASERSQGEAGPLVGTPAYLAPELVHGDPASERSDLYALGIVGWTMLTGRLPFNDDEPGQVLLRQVREPIPPLARAAAATPGRLARAIEMLLAKDPAARPDRVESWLALLEGTPRAAALAAPLERWLTIREAVRPFHALAVTSVGMLGAVALLMTIYNTAPPYLILGKLLLGVLAVTATIQVGIGIRTLRRAARAGFRVEDLRVAIERRVAERQARGPELPTTIGRLLRAAAQLSLLALLALVGVAMLGGLGAWAPWGFRLWLWRNQLEILPIAWIAFWTLRGLGILVPGRTRPALDRRWKLRLAFWRSSLSESLYRVLSTGLSPQSATSTLHRPTELMLGLEIGELWRALPDATRFGLGDLPSTTEALRRRVDEIRTAIAHLEAMPTSLDDDLAAVLDRLVERRDHALGALERLRLLLLQLTTDTVLPGEFTRQLHDARDLEHSLLEEFGAHARVRSLIRSGPVVTPA